MPPTNQRLNFHDPMQDRTNQLASKGAFNPFQSLVVGPATQRSARQTQFRGDTAASGVGDGRENRNDEVDDYESYVSDSEDYYDTESDSEEETEVPNEPARRMALADVQPAVKPVLPASKPPPARRAAAAQVNETEAPKLTAQRTSAAPAQPMVKVPAQPVATETKTATSVGSATKIEGGPRGIMDYSVAFLKRNFWPILTVIVVLIAIGVAFIFFAHRPQQQANPAKSTIVGNSGGTVGVDAAAPPIPWADQSTSGSSDIAEADVGAEINTVQAAELAEQRERAQQALREKQALEESRQQLQERVAQIEADIAAATTDQATQLAEIEKLQGMCDRLMHERSQLERDNNTLASVITQAGILADETQQKEVPADSPENNQTSTENNDGSYNDENLDSGNVQGQLLSQQASHLTEFDSGPDYEAIEKSVADELLRSVTAATFSAVEIVDDVSMPAVAQTAQSATEDARRKPRLTILRDSTTNNDAVPEWAVTNQNTQSAPPDMQEKEENGQASETEATVGPSAQAMPGQSDDEPFEPVVHPWEKNDSATYVLDHATPPVTEQTEQQTSAAEKDLAPESLNFFPDSPSNAEQSAEQTNESEVE